ncbi:response regulator [Sphingomonas sp. AP4-R1]|uniref:response regulator n=1 Tax=Sphingomonas sp. AP4-R1 TaxID=2735134 RepID=UPI0014938AA2|nr:response regulator [Sphingomonas sp. AP4-R1]QJU58215.1 response regulator [Sphingomonas sp. AP4-R1]
MCHVLIIEDEPIIAQLLQDLLEDEGATSFAIADSQEAAVASAMAERPAFITSDVKLTHGTGPLAVSTIHQRLGTIPVVFITGTPDECSPCDPPGRIFSKPLDRGAIAAAFHELGPIPL